MIHVKGSAVTSRIRFVRERYGEASFRDLKGALTDEQRGRIEARILPAQWVPYDLFVHLVVKINAMFGQGDLGLVREMAHFSADMNLPTLYRIFYKMGTPSFILKRAARLWQLHYDSGRLEVKEHRPGHARLLIEGGAHVPYVSTSIGQSMLTASDEAWLRAHGTEQNEFKVYRHVAHTIRALAEAGGVEDALVELVTNGVQHNDCDEPHVTVTVERDDGDLLLVVTDDGGGPHPDDLPSLDDEREPLAHGVGGAAIPYGNDDVTAAVEARFAELFETDCAVFLVTTGTAANDKTECAAVADVFGAHADDLMISSTKSMHGHLIGGTGAVELLACIMAVRDGVIAPTIGYEEPDPECALDVVPNEAREARVEVAVSNAFAFGGFNAVLVLRRP